MKAEETRGFTWLVCCCTGCNCISFRFISWQSLASCCKSGCIRLLTKNFTVVCYEV